MKKEKNNPKYSEECQTWNNIFAPIINPPESAILGVGRIVKKPIVVNDQIIIKPIMTLTLVWDHRVMDGVIAARFLRTIKETLENPYLLTITQENWLVNIEIYH